VVGEASPDEFLAALRASPEPQSQAAVELVGIGLDQIDEEFDKYPLVRALRAAMEQPGAPARQLDRWLAGLENRPPPADQTPADAAAATSSAVATVESAAAAATSAAQPATNQSQPAAAPAAAPAPATPPPAPAPATPAPASETPAVPAPQPSDAKPSSASRRGKAVRATARSQPGG
jgi:hypothetical protein